ncbi:hypothetical protein J5N97_004852 [Dioscorea zingiberensis]|uniref:CTLH domain-containing protein n=1 Tax=Dioscorea zingiberensis TaxID=325984 RepID=A0A9D5D709_9LILI|nr:hypothetical protein J5N97_004852 [Dioscorea zingiberensis]
MTNDDPKHCVRVHFILQYLKSAGLDDTAHTLERESGLFFNVDRLEAFLMAGDWDVAERYISGFTSINDSRASMQLFFEIRKQKYLEALDDDPDHHRAFSILQTELQPFSAYAPVLFSELTLLLTKKNFRENKELAKYGNAEMSRKMLVGVIRKLVHANPKLRDLVKTPNPHLSTLLSLLRARQEMATNQQRVNHPRPPNGAQKPCAIPQKRPSLVSDSRAAKRPRDNLPPRSNVQKLCAIRPTIPTPVSVSKMVPHQLSTSTPLSSAVENLCPIRETIPSSQQRACSKGVCANGQPEIPPSAAITDEASGSSGISRISADQLPQATATRSPTDLQAHYFNSSPNTCKADSNVVAFTMEKAACREPCHIAYPEVSMANAGSSWNNQAAEPHTMNSVVKFSDPSPLPKTPASEKHVESNGLSHPPVAPNPAPAAAQTTNPPPMCCSVVSSVDSPIAQAAAPNLKSCSENWKIVARNPIPSTLGPSLGVSKGCEGDPRPSQRLEASHLRSHVAAKGDNSDLADKEDSFCWPTEAILVKGTSTPEKSVTPRKRSGAQDEATNFTKSCKRLQTTETSDTNVSSCTPGHIPHANTSSAVKSDYINSRSEAAEGKEKCKLLAIDEPSECHSLRLLDSSPVKVLRLMYSHSGDALWALAFNGVNKLWQWKKIDKNSTGKADVRQQPELKTPVNDKVLANELSATATNKALHWFALSRNDGYLMSLSGGPISLYNTKLRKRITTIKIFMGTPYTATCFVFLPKDNNTIVVGMEDSTIIVYEIRSDQVRFNLTGHNRRITSLALSPTLNLLVSSGEDAQICTWNLSEIEEPQENRILKRMPRGRVSTLVMKKVQFHPDGMHFLAVCKRQLLTFKASELKLLHRMNSPRAITDATYSCDGQSIYCSFEDGSVVVLSTLLDCKCWISQKTYLHQPISLSVIPHAIAAHPKIPNQFAVGLSDGGVHVLEPLESEGQWSGSKPLPQDVAWRRYYPPRQAC